jgi:hypothetical protein
MDFAIAIAIVANTILATIIYLVVVWIWDD